jgi:ribulose bisphosphate carboxylase small subunit
MASTPNQASLLNLPSIAEVKNLVEDSLTHDWILRIEHFGPGASTSPSRQWQQWGDSLFAIPDASSVIDGIVACRASHPAHCIRLHAEKVNPRTQMYYPVYRPDPRGKEAGMLHHASVVPDRIIAWVSSLANGTSAMRGMAWKIITVAGMLFASLLMLEEVLA